MKKLLSLLIVIVTIFTSCDKKDDSPDIPNVNIVDVSQETEWDYLVANTNGSLLLAKEHGGLPDEVFYKPSVEHEGFPIYFDDNGLPSKMVVEEFIFLFGNFNGSNCDVVIIDPNGKLEVFRGVETSSNWNELNLKSAEITSSKGTFFRILGHAASGAVCAGSVAAAAASGGFAIPAAVLSCTSFAANIAADIINDDVEVLGVPVAKSLGIVSTAASCAQVYDPSGYHQAICLGELTGHALYTMADAEDHLAAQQEEVHLGKGIATTGNGDIKVTLSWYTLADLDLYVVDPNGEEIYWQNENAQSGGYLDVDDIDGYGEENIFWEDGTAPSGTYSVYVHYYPWWSESNRPAGSDFNVYVKAFDDEDFFEGHIERDDIKHITDFDRNGLKSLKIMEFTVPEGDKDF